MWTYNNFNELYHADGGSRKNHKYIKKYRGRSGKWVYVYSKPKSSYRTTGGTADSSAGRSALKDRDAYTFKNQSATFEGMNVYFNGVTKSEASKGLEYAKKNMTVNPGDTVSVNKTSNGGLAVTVYPNITGKTSGFTGKDFTGTTHWLMKDGKVLHP